MIINKTINDADELTISIEGKIDSANAPDLEAVLKDHIHTVNVLIFDLSKLEYTSSAGLRILLGSHKAMAKHGKMVIRGATPEVMEIFSITGVADVLNIE